MTSHGLTLRVYAMQLRLLAELVRGVWEYGVLRHTMGDKADARREEIALLCWEAEKLEQECRDHA